MSQKMQGIVRQYGAKGFGFIRGDDGRDYFFHRLDIVNRAGANIEEKVSFYQTESEKGWVAKEIHILNGGRSNDNRGNTRMPRRHRLSDIRIKFLFTVLFIIQMFTLYLVLV